MDVNFSLAPAVFEQLYVIRAPLGTTCISRLCTPSCWRPLPTRAGARLQLRPNHGRHQLRDGGDACCDGHVWAAGARARAGLLLPPLREHVEVCPGSGADRPVQHGQRRQALRRDAGRPGTVAPGGRAGRGMAHLRANTPSTSTTSSTTLTPRTSLDDTASFSLPPSTPPRLYHQPGSDDSRPCSPLTCGTSTSPPSLGRTGRTTCASPGTRHSSDSSATSIRGCGRC